MHGDLSPAELLNKGIRSDAEIFLLKFQESFKDERIAFIQNSKKIIKNAVFKDKEQQTNIETLPDNIFRHYTLYYFAEEQTAKEGQHFKSTVGVKLTEYIDEHGESQGDEIQLYIVIPEDLIITNNTDSTVISSWLDSVNEVYVCHKTGKVSKRKAAMYRILPEGYQLYSPEEDESQIDFDQELQSMIADTPDITALAKMTLNNTASIYELLVKLGTFKCVPQRNTKLTQT
jgi:hypothetical protein